MIAVRTVLGVAAGFALTLTLALSLPRVAGVRAYTELSGSMAPALAPGDVLLTQTVRAADLRPGEVVTFPDPERDGRLLTHRVRSMNVDRGIARFVTQGDANTGTERWSARADGHLGRVTRRVPLVGHATARLGGPVTWLALVAIPSVWLLVAELRRIWRREPEERYA